MVIMQTRAELEQKEAERGQMIGDLDDWVAVFAENSIFDEDKKLDNIFMIIVVTHPTLSSFAEDYTEEEKTIFGEHQLLC